MFLTSRIDAAQFGEELAALVPELAAFRGGRYRRELTEAFWRRWRNSRPSCPCPTCRAGPDSAPGRAFIVWPEALRASVSDDCEVPARDSTRSRVPRRC